MLSTAGYFSVKKSQNVSAKTYITFTIVQLLLVIITSLYNYTCFVNGF